MQHTGTPTHSGEPTHTTYSLHAYPTTHARTVPVGREALDPALWHLAGRPALGTQHGGESLHQLLQTPEAQGVGAGQQLRHPDPLRLILLQTYGTLRTHAEKDVMVECIQNGQEGTPVLGGPTAKKKRKIR